MQNFEYMDYGMKIYSNTTVDSFQVFSFINRGFVKSWIVTQLLTIFLYSQSLSKIKPLQFTESKQFQKSPISSIKRLSIVIDRNQIRYKNIFATSSEFELK